MNSARPSTLGCEASGSEILDLEPRAGGFQMRRRHAARELHAQIHRGRRARRRGNICRPVDAEHVGDLMGIADRGGDAMGEHAAVEFERRDQRGFDMQMRVDEAGYDDLAGDVDLARAAIFALRAHDAVAADRDVALDQFAARPDRRCARL